MNMVVQVCENQYVRLVGEDVGSVGEDIRLVGWMSGWFWRIKGCLGECWLGRMFGWLWMMLVGWGGCKVGWVG
jgi:hypothetical protein